MEITMTQIDPDNIATDVEITLRLPRIIAVQDYHEFRRLQDFINDELELEGVYISEVGFIETVYVGLIHTDCAAHNQMVLELNEHYEQLENS
jgi:hypothetical protein